MENEIEKVTLETKELAALEPSKAAGIRKIFSAMADSLDEFDARYQEVMTAARKAFQAGDDKAESAAVIADAKRLRLDIGKIRINAEKARKAEKESYLKAGKAIDGVANILKWAVEGREDSLKKVETHFEDLERERMELLQSERVSLIAPYMPDANEKNLAQMDDEVWDAYFATKKAAHEQAIEAAKVAEAERILREKAEAEERERIRKENEKLKAEAEAARKAAAEEAARVAQERAKEAAAAEEERRVHAAAMKAEQEKQRAAEEEARRLREAAAIERAKEAAAAALKEKAEADTKNRARIHTEILSAILNSEDNIVTEDDAKAIVRMIARGLVPHVSIDYTGAA
jgi:hypothetical protein